MINLTDQNGPVCWPSWMGETPRVNCPWNAAEEKLLVARFKAGDTLGVLAQRHGRATGGIESRLFLLLGENFGTRSSPEYCALKDLMKMREELARLTSKVNDSIGSLDCAFPGLRRTRGL